MDGVEKVVLKMIGNKENQNKYLLYKLRLHWTQIIGKVNARHCQPGRLDRRVLFLNVDSSTWANQFMFLKAELVTRINAYLCLQAIKDVKFTITSDLHFLKKERVLKPSAKIILPPLSEEELQEVKAKFSQVKNEDLRQKIVSIESKKAGLAKLYEAGKIKKCQGCGVYVYNNEKYCANCVREQEEKQRQKLAKLMKAEPWLKFDDLHKRLKCDKIEFSSVRDNLKNFYFDKVKRGFASLAEQELAVLLKCSKRRSELSETEYANILAYLGERKKNVRTSGSKLYNKK